MKTRIGILIVALITILTLVACGENEANNELVILEVEFEVPETLDVDEKLILEALVTYGDETVTDADEVIFEVWEKNDQENSLMIDSVNNEDGTYTAETSFDHDGIFEMYAHTTAREMHTMPKREIVVGEGGEYADEDEESHFHAEGFDMHFMNPDVVKIDEDVELMVHLLMNDDPFADANVRYEIWSESTEDDRDWVDAEETNTGEYIATYTFTNKEQYNIQIHVEDDNDLHEHEQHEIIVE